MPGHTANNLVGAWFIRSSKQNRFGISWLQIHLPINIGFICLIKHFACIFPILHHDEAMLHRAVVGNLKGNILSSWDDEFIWIKRKICHCEADPGGWA